MRFCDGQGALMLVATPPKNKSKPRPSFAQRKGLLVSETREVREHSQKETAPGHSAGLRVQPVSLLPINLPQSSHSGFPKTAILARTSTVGWVSAGRSPPFPRRPPASSACVALPWQPVCPRGGPC